MNNAVLGKIMENMEKHRDIKLATTERKRNYLLSEPNYQIRRFFTKYLLAIEMEKTILMNTNFTTFSRIMWNQNIVKNQNCVIVSLYT